MKEIIERLRIAFKGRDAAQTAYNQWHDEFFAEFKDRPTSKRNDEEIRKEYNKEAGLRTNICYCDTIIQNIAREIAEFKE